MDGHLTAAAFADFGTHWPVFLAIPLAAGVLGFLLNRLARQLMFRPSRRIGIGPVGWQAIVTRDAERLARAHTDLIVGELLSAQEILSRLEPAQITVEITGPLRRATAELATEIAQRYTPRLWEVLPEPGKQLLGYGLRTRAPEVVRRVVEQIEVHVDDVFDFDHLVHRALTEDPALLERLITVTGDRAFRALERRGACVGFGIGLMGALVVAVTGQALVLPLVGLVIGVITRPLGRQLLFARYPGAPDPLIRIRRSVAVSYAGTVSSDIVTFARVIDELSNGTHSGDVQAMIRRNVHHAVDSQVGVAKPLVTAAVGARTLQDMKRAAAEGAIRRFPEVMRHAEGYATEAMDVRNTVLHRALRMKPEVFQQLLRPALASGAIRLSLLSGIIGLGVGIIAVLLR